ncbi:mitochondrial ribosomal subunit S27-domain-containing protein [Paraphysoderma sedebokerense]|nr:mitochondrial ribosomal subunit S27-domain-containing protein [Paraphysoderma sedebokerense]
MQNQNFWRYRFEVAQTMSSLIPKQRLASLQKLTCSVFGTVYNPTNARTGNRILRASLKGPVINSYYPPDPPKIRHLNSVFGKFGIKLVDPEETERLNRVERLRRRGKGAPKKGQGRRAQMGKKK